MTESESEAERTARMEAALAESQRSERAELRADLDRQRRADERMVDALAESGGHASQDPAGRG